MITSTSPYKFNKICIYFVEDLDLINFERIGELGLSSSKQSVNSTYLVHEEPVNSTYLVHAN